MGISIHVPIIMKLKESVYVMENVMELVTNFVHSM